MTLSKRITDEMKTAMKAKDAERLSTLRMIRAGIIEAEKSGKGEVTDESILNLIRRMRKQRQEAAEQYDKGDRPELAAKERAEMLILEDFLPQMAGEEQMRAWVTEAIASSGAAGPADMGKVMGAVMKDHRDVVDGKVVRSLALELLG